MFDFPWLSQPPQGAHASMKTWVFVKTYQQIPKSHMQKYNTKHQTRKKMRLWTARFLTQPSANEYTVAPLTWKRWYTSVCRLMNVPGRWIMHMSVFISSTLASIHSSTKWPENTLCVCVYIVLSNSKGNVTKLIAVLLQLLTDWLASSDVYKTKEKTVISIWLGCQVKCLGKITKENSANSIWQGCQVFR